MPEGIFLEKTDESIDTWAFVEIMGHSRAAGRISERKIGVQVMFQVDIPKGETEFSHSELYSPSSIFSIKPTTEEWCRAYNKHIITHDVLPYIPERPNARLLPEGDEPEDHEFDAFEN